MILSRLTNAIRRQDWFTVLTELVIVVLGIFLGLQANEWAQDRQDLREERAALERLYLESRSAFEQLSGQLDYTERLNQMRRDAVRFVDGDAPVPQAELPLKIGINTLAQFPPVVPVTVVYEELKASGQMQLIRSADLRDQIARFHTYLAGHNQVLASFRSDAGRFFDAYQRHVTWDFNPEATTSDILLSTFDWDSLRADESFVFLTIAHLRNQLVAEESLIALRDQARALCETLASRTSQTCELAAP
jgi:hypothetical protein